MNAGSELSTVWLGSMKSPGLHGSIRGLLERRNQYVAGRSVVRCSPFATDTGAFIVNGGQLLLRWTNDCFLATPHRAVNCTSSERYALAFFCDAQIDWPIAAVPTCVSPGHPPRYETTYYTDYMIKYQARTYNVFDDQAEAMTVLDRPAQWRSMARTGEA